tara:strand:+ start:310 stop:714 length:405 start_codon:yes stop_codon:yes gene_type:complete
MFGNYPILKGKQVGLMKEDFETVYDMLEHALEYAFEGKMQLKFYDYLKNRKTKKAEIDSFLESSTAKEIADTVVELEEYIKGGADNEHKQIREAYHHIPKPQARKIRKYLYGILEDAWRYQHDRRPGRRKKESK